MFLKYQTYLFQIYIFKIQSIFLRILKIEFFVRLTLSYFKNFVLNVIAHKCLQKAVYPLSAPQAHVECAISKYKQFILKNPLKIV